MKALSSSCYTFEASFAAEIPAVGRDSVDYLQAMSTKNAHASNYSQAGSLHVTTGCESAAM